MSLPPSLPPPRTIPELIALLELSLVRDQHPIKPKKAPPKRKRRARK